MTIPKNSNSRDHLSPEDRSRNMAKVKQSNTAPEVLLRKMLHKAGFRFRKNVKTYLVNRILCCRNIKQSFSFTVVFGTDIIAEEAKVFHLQERSFGLKNSKKMSSEIE
jgi:hypothetical protein